MVDRTTLQRLLVHVFGLGIGLSRWEVFEPWSVARIHLQDGDPRSVIVKWLRAHPQGLRTDPAQMLTELTALEFLNRIDSSVCARIFGADLTRSLLVMEDIPGRPLLEYIVERDARSAHGLVAFAAMLGRLHTATHGLSDLYYESRARLGPVDRSFELRRFFEPLANIDELAARLNVPHSRAVKTDLERVIVELTSPQPFLAFSNGDAAANNFMFDGETGRLIDFEFAGYRHCLTDISCLYVPGPQWMTVADPRHDGTEAAYRGELVSAIPEAADDSLYGMGVASAGIAYALLRISDFDKLDARPPGHESRRQRVSTLEAAASTAERFRCLVSLRGWIRRLAEQLRARWPDANVDFGALADYSRRV